MTARVLAMSADHWECLRETESKEDQNFFTALPCCRCDSTCCHNNSTDDGQLRIPAKVNTDSMSS